MNKNILVLAVLVLHVLVVSSTINLCYNFKKNVEELTQVQNTAEPELDDSYYVGHYELNFTHPAISLDIIFDNLTVSNLKKVDVSVFNDLDQKLNITFANISSVGEYDLTGNIGDLFNIFGKGHFWAHLLNFSIAVAADPFINASSICIPTAVEVRLGQCQIHFSHFMGDESMGDLMNKAFSNMIPEIVRVFWDEFIEANDARIEKWLNSIINGNSMVNAMIEEKLRENLGSGLLRSHLETTS